MNEQPHIDIKVSTQYLPEHSDPHNAHFTFAYSIIITNQGTEAAKLLSRHWVINDANGEIQEVRGVGVVGEQPHLQPGQHFQYTSSAIIKTPVGSMQGSYHMVDDHNQHFEVDIPIFRLAAPNAVN
ncbi:MAG: Co2+/Mg2+ efflux protein ApaG [Legionellales bacterium]|nr:Co2+/Mg2+ efflux protein ApaG [Legionellales bacterium]